MKTLQLFIAGSLLMTGSWLSAQTTGIIKGTLTDLKGEPMLFANVALLDDTTMIANTQTDDKGDYAFKQITPGTYNLKFSFVGYTSKKIKGVNVDPLQIAYVNTSMSENVNTLATAEKVEHYESTIINPTYSTITPIRTDQIEHMAAAKGDITAIIVAVTPGVLASEDGKDLYIRGSRSGSTQYIVDGNKVMTASSPGVPGTGIANMEVLTGGVPAEYGDCTGGIVIITTKEYKWEMRRKEMQQRARAEEEAAEKAQQAQKKEEQH